MIAAVFLCPDAARPGNWIAGAGTPRLFFGAAAHRPMSQHHMRSLGIAAAWLGILLAGAVAGWFGSEVRRTQLLGQLLDDARRSAVAFATPDRLALTGTPVDVATDAYAAVKERLRRLKALEPRVRFVYLFRHLPAEDRVVFLADSAEPGAADESLPGDAYPQAAQSPGLREIIRTGQPATEGPLADDFGTWVTGYAFVGTGPEPPAGAPPQDILGLDFDADDWRWELWKAAWHRAGLVWLVLALPFGALRVSRRQIEQREVIRNLSEAMEQSHSAILIIDLGNHIEYANRGLCQQLGYTRRELIGRNWREIRAASSSDEGLAELLGTVRAGRAWEGEWHNVRRDGSVYPVHGVVTPVKHRDGSLACFVAVFDDITEARRREAELREARDLAEAGDRAKGQFLATMSHEVRTPLNGIVGFTSLLLETRLSPEQRDYVQTIQSSGEALIQITADVLDFARIQSGRMKLDPFPLDPRACVEEALDLLAAKAAEKGIVLLHRFAPDVPATILADGMRLRQVLVNLLGNALKFTEHGEVEVVVALAREGDEASGGSSDEPPGASTLESGGAVETPSLPAGSAAGSAFPFPAPPAGGYTFATLAFSVRDTGIGIAADQQARLFKPFSQIDDSSTRRYGGTGLGLAICRQIVRLMGGEISVASERGRGSTFTFTFRAPVTVPLPPDRNLGGLRIGLALRPGALRRELAALLSEWHAQVFEVDMPEELAGATWELGLVGLDEEGGSEFAARTGPLLGLPPDRTFALVPLSFPAELRTALVPHFRALLNLPLHQAALFTLLSGSREQAPRVAALVPARFGYRVLVAEDNRVNQRLIQRVLANLGCAATIVETGRQVLDELARDAAGYDLLLLDLHMPEMDGFTALEQIRAGQAGPQARDLWIIALTADAREAQRARGLAAGLNEYLTKPLRMAEFEAALRRYHAARAARGDLV